MFFQKDASEQKLWQKKINQLLKKAEIPVLSVVARRLLELQRDERAGFSDFSRILESDQGMASSILKLANSAYYGLRIKATSLERAIGVLGLKQVLSMTLGVHLTKALSRMQIHDFDMKRFWQINLVQAVFARQLAAGYCPQRKEEAFLLGLLQNCGILILVQAIGAEYAELYNQTPEHERFYQLEKKYFNYNHVLATNAICQKWELPELLVKPIRTHHYRSQAAPSMSESVQLVQVAYFSGTITSPLMREAVEKEAGIVPYSEHAFGLDEQRLREIIRLTREEYYGVAQLFANIIPELSDVEDIFEQIEKNIAAIPTALRV